jgi:predicted RNA-binding Zn-ribbon protein involved in translation (DUF1610 family)
LFKTSVDIFWLPEMKVTKSPTIFPMPTCPPQEIVALEKCREIAADLGTDVLTEKDEKDQ